MLVDPLTGVPAGNLIMVTVTSPSTPVVKLYFIAAILLWYHTVQYTVETELFKLLYFSYIIMIS